MAPTLKDRVRETTDVSGTTAQADLGGALSKYRTFVAGYGNGNEAYYCIVSRDPALNEWEIGYATVTDDTTDYITRDAAKVLAGSAGAGVLVNFTAGTKDIWGDAPGDKLFLSDGSRDLDGALNFSGAVDITQTAVATGNVNVGTNAFTLTSGGVTIAGAAAQTFAYLVDGLATTRTRSHGTASAPLVEYQSSRGTQAAPTAIQDTDPLITLRAEGYDTASYEKGAELRAVATENWTASARGAKWQFVTTIAGGIVETVALELDGLSLKPGGPIWWVGGDGEINVDTGQEIRLEVNATAVATINASGLTLASGQFLAPDGSAAAPAYSFSSDPADGIYHDTDLVAVAIAGTRIFSVDEQGNLAVNTSTPKTILSWTMGATDVAFQMTGPDDAYLVIQGDATANQSWIDAGAVADDKWMNFQVAAGTAKFHTYTDSGGARVDRIFVMDMGNGNVSWGGIPSPSVKAKFYGDVWINESATPQLLLDDGANDQEIRANANVAGADSTILLIAARWNNTAVASIGFESGTDTVNKDDGQIVFKTAAAGTVTEAVRIHEAGHTTFGPGSYGVTIDPFDVNDAANITLDSSASAAERIFFGTSMVILSSGTITSGLLATDGISIDFGNEVGIDTQLYASGGAVNIAYKSYTVTATSKTLDLDEANLHIVDMTAATGTTTYTLANTGLRGSSEGYFIIEQGATARNILWAITAGSVTWTETEPTWTGDTNKKRKIHYLYDETYGAYLTPMGTAF